MKKLLPAIALALPFAASAQSQVNIYGVVDAFTGRMATASAPQAMNVVNSGGMITSFYGFSGAEALGGGLKAQFQLEGFFRGDTGEGGRVNGEAMFARNANVGLAGQFGMVRLGRIGNPLFIAAGQINPFGPSTRLSPLINQIFTIPGGNATLGDTGWSNSIQYASNPVHDTTFIAQYSLGEQPGVHNNNWAAVAKYVGQELAVTLGAQDVRFGPGVSLTVPQQRTYLAAASYDFKAVKLYASYSHHSAKVSEREGHSVQAGFTVPAQGGAGRWMVSWSRLTEQAKIVPEFHRDTAAAGYDYNLSPRTDLYAVLMYDKISNAGKGNTYVGGLRHRF
ncbi:porin [Pseudoduganella eburnea]|uniref:Porin n=1 Tax=Massilia eburnea TaxID=1776165 RepID=A0A6L6QH43_9BURK|nr:porin [Massilia eburnea]MTW11227.1 porin [Massilia eburnea]